MSSAGWEGSVRMEGDSVESDTLLELGECYAEGVRLRRELADIKRQMAAYDDTVLPGGRTVLRSRGPLERRQEPKRGVDPSAAQSKSPSATARERAARLLQQRERGDRLRGRARQDDGEMSSGSEAELAVRASRMEDMAEAYEGRGASRGLGHNPRLQRAFSGEEAELQELSPGRDPYADVIADAEEEAIALREARESPTGNSSPGSFGSVRSGSPVRSRSPSPDHLAVGPDPRRVLELRECLDVLQAEWHPVWKLTKGGKGRANKRKMRVKFGAPGVLLWESQDMFGFKSQKSFRVRDMYFGEEFSASVVREGGSNAKVKYRDEWAILFEQDPGDGGREVLIIACMDAKQFKLWTKYKEVLRWHAQTHAIQESGV